MGQHTFALSLASKPSGALLRSGSLASLNVDMHKADLAAAHEAGFRAGQTEAHQRAAQAMDLAVDRLDKAREEALEALSTSTVELSVEIARQIVSIEINAGNYDLERIVRGALSQSSAGRGEALVHVSPQDHENLKNVTFRNGTEVAIDTTLQPGDVHVQTPQGLLVREISDCLSAVREQLMEDLA